MPNRAVHDVAGTAAGVLLAVHLAGDQANQHILLEALGGCIGGLTASRLPDKIDPPTGPNHCDVGHAVLVAGGMAVAIWRGAEQAQDALHGYADSLAAERAVSNSMSELEKFLNRSLEAVCRILAGVIAGAIGGYVSHLALDMGSPSGLPLLCKGM